MKNIVSVDYKNDSPKNEFSKSLEQHTREEWEVYSCVSNTSPRTMSTEIKRYLKYIYVGFHFWRCRKSVKKLVAWQQFHGIFFGFFCRLFHAKKTTELIIMTFIYKRKSGFAGSIYERFIRYAVSNKYVDKIVCFSEKEIDYYNKLFDIPKEKFVYMKVAASPIPAGIDYKPTEPRYIFSAGYSHRDFDFLVNAIKGTKYQLVIADDKVTDPHTENIKILRHCYGVDMLKELGKCYVFINPLKDKTISAGQLMSINAMQLHKPIVCTDSEGMRPYVKEGLNGFFIENRKEDLLAVLDKLYNDSDLYDKMSNDSFQFCQQQFSWTRLGKDVAEIL